MDRPVIITADSTCDLSPELCERYGISVIPLTIALGADSFPDDGRFRPEEMYRRYREDGLLPATAAPSLQAYLDFFSGVLARGGEIVHLTICSDLSASFNSARLAAQELTGVHVVDTRSLSAGVGLLAVEGAERAREGMDAASVAAHLTSLTDKVDVSFVLDTLEYMRKGGRCSGIVAIGANLLHLKPALAMKDGALMVYKKYRGELGHVWRQYLTERFEERRPRPGHVYLADSGELSEEERAELMELTRSLSGAREVHHVSAGCTVSSHCGPRTLGVMFLEE